MGCGARSQSIKSVLCLEVEMMGAAQWRRFGDPGREAGRETRMTD